MRPRRGSEAARAARVRRRIRRPSAHWVLLGLVVVVLVLLLLVQGITVRRVGASATPTAQTAGTPLAGSRPLLTVTDGRLVSRQPPPGRRVALTFDDGPEPDLDAADRSRCCAASTCRRRSSRSAARWRATRASSGSCIVEGFELGNHTFTHVDAHARAELARARSRSR